MNAGEKLRKARERQGLSQRAVAELIGVSQPTIQSWESGETSPRAKRVRKVARIYGLRPQELLPEAA